MPFGSLGYTPGVPNPPNLPSVDVPDMQINTNSVQTYLERDHVPFSNSFAGAHQQVNIIETSTSGTPTLPSLLVGAGSGTIYTSTNSAQIGGNSGELFFTRGGSGIQIQMTGPLSPTPMASPASGNNSNGYTFLPGAILLQWGSSVSFGNTNSLTINFPVTFTNLFVVLVNGNSSNVGFNVTSSTTNSFVVKTIGGATTNGQVDWIAIGN